MRLGSMQKDCDSTFLLVVLFGIAAGEHMCVADSSVKHTSELNNDTAVQLLQQLQPQCEN